jgi:hypothetical protein
MRKGLVIMGKAPGRWDGGILSGKRDIPRAILGRFVNNIPIPDKKMLVFIPKVSYSMQVTS